MKKSKPLLGRWISNRLFLSDEEKLIIINDYLSGNESKQVVYERHTGYAEEHGKITSWMRALNIDVKPNKNSTFACMSTHRKDKSTNSEEFELLKLKKRIEELEKQLQTAEMKAVAFSTMVDIAEREFNIPIRKRHNTKP